MVARTNIVLDDELVAKAMARAGVKTKKAAVEAALRAFVRKPDYSGLLALAGTGVIAEDYDPKALFTHPRYPAHAVNEPQPPYPPAKTGRRPAKRAKPAKRSA
jgi:Arc/MetJ family transcription regulator